jgi:hypothetical protein
MRFSRPSPSLVVAIGALVVATAGSAAAAGVMITNSSQVKSGAINGKNIRNGSITGRDIAPNSISARNLDPSVALSTAATEVFRKSGPEGLKPGERKLATLSQLQPGTYAIFAKTTLSPTGTDRGLLEALFKQAKTSGGICSLDAAGDQDRSSGVIVTPGTAHPVTLSMQLTRTIAAPGDVSVSCSVEDIVWRASDTSIIALRLGNSARTAVTQ